MKRETLNPATLSRPGTYSHVRIVPAGRQVHISSQVAFNAAGEPVGKGDLADQTEQVYGTSTTRSPPPAASLADVFQIVTYVVGIAPDKVATIRAARARFLGDGPYPRVDHGRHDRAGPPRPADRGRGDRRDRLAATAPVTPGRPG